MGRAAWMPVLLLVAACGSGSEPVTQGTQSPESASAASEVSDEEQSQPTTSSVATSKTSVTEDVVYATRLDGQRAGDPWELDLYRPETGADLPVIVLLHGNGVGKSAYAEWSEQIAGLGALVYTIAAPVSGTPSMALSNGAGFRDISEVLGCAVGSARATAGDLGGDTDRVALVAHSWGSLYGAWFALGSDALPTKWDQYAAVHGGPPPQASCEVDSSAQVEAFIGIGGGRYGDVEETDFEDDTELAELVSPFSYLGQDTSLPTRLLLGNDDRGIDRESSPAFNRALLEAGYDSDLIAFDGAHVVPPGLTFETVSELTSS